MTLLDHANTANTLSIRAMLESPWLYSYEETEGVMQFTFDYGSHKEVINVSLQDWHKFHMGNTVCQEIETVKSTV